MTIVSVVVPAYNHARFLEQALESVLGQTYPQVELIVLDDGSTDGTAQVLAKYGKRFYWETQPNMGQAATLNKGWSMARGAVLGYLSADDYLHPEAVRRAVDALASDPRVVLVYPDFAHVDEASRELDEIRRPEFRYSAMLLEGTCPPGPGAFFRRSAYAAAGGWDSRLRRIPDFAYWLKLGLLGPFRRIPEVLAYYRIHAGAQSFSRVDAVRADEIIAVIDSVLADPALPQELRARDSEARSNALLHAARLHFMSGRTRLALARAVEALRADPIAALRPRSHRLLLSGLLWRLRTAQ